MFVNKSMLNINGGVTLLIQEKWNCSVRDICDSLKNNALGFEPADCYVLHNGKIISSTDPVPTGVLHFVPRLRGGKGGFGSMLRAIGAQIEKTTNREACRDLSGRRLRDINEEKRLKNWIAQQADRERDTAERRQKKLARLCAEPRHEFKDQTYELERSELTENVSAAVEQGFKATCSNEASKRKCDSQSRLAKKKKKTCMWLDADADLSSAESDDLRDSEEEEEELSSCVKACSEPLAEGGGTSASPTEDKPCRSKLSAESSVSDHKVRPSCDEESSSSASSEPGLLSRDEDKLQGGGV